MLWRESRKPGRSRVALAAPFLIPSPKPPHRTPRIPARLSFLLLLSSILLFNAAARCGEPGTRAVIFVQGLYTTLDEDGTQTSLVEEHRFETMKRAFIDADYKPQQLLDYSYEGGAVSSTGVWKPEAYACEVTDRQALKSVELLEQMVRDYRKKHPKARVTLVGHSLGGWVAYLAGVREAERAKGDRIGIDGVVTLDAPLRGASPDKKPLIDLFGCEKTYIAGAELVVIRADASTDATRAAQAQTMTAAGVRLATLGNLNDCLWATVRCLGGTWVDDGPTQFIEGAELSRGYEVLSGPLQSHEAILIDPAAIADVVAFVGNP